LKDGTRKLSDTYEELGRPIFQVENCVRKNADQRAATKNQSSAITKLGPSTFPEMVPHGSLVAPLLKKEETLLQVIVEESLRRNSLP